MELLSRRAADALALSGTAIVLVVVFFAIWFALGGCAAEADDPPVIYQGERLVEFDVHAPPGVIERTMDSTCPEGFTLSAAREGYRLFATCLAAQR